MSSFALCVERQIQQLLDYKAVQFQVKNKKSSCRPSLGSDGPIDRVQVVISYCNVLITWDVIFSHDFSVLPDFVFGQGEENFVSLEKVVSTVKWDLKNSSCLLDLMLYLLQEYRAFHRKRVLAVPHERLQFDLQTIPADLSIELLYLDCVRNEHEEVIRSQPEVWCAVELPIASLAEVHQNEKHPVLFVRYRLQGVGSSPAATLDIPRFWKDIIGEVKTPSWPNNAGLNEYILSVQTALAKNVQDYRLRRELILALQQVLGTPSEYDSENYFYVTFILECSNVPFFVHINLSQKFPLEKPRISFHSLLQSNEKRGKPYHSIVSSYPYSSQWELDELVIKIRKYISDALVEFKKCCQTEDY